MLAFGDRCHRTIWHNAHMKPEKNQCFTHKWAMMPMSRPKIDQLIGKHNDCDPEKSAQFQMVQWRFCCQ